MAIEGIIFDWAGTTIDYGCFSPVAAFMTAFEEYGLPITVEEAREPMGIQKIDHTRAILKMERVSQLFEQKFGRAPTEDDVETIYQGFERVLFESLVDYVELNPYVLEIINTLQDRGIKIGTTTGYTKEMLDVILPIAAEKGYEPQFSIASDQVKKGRPYGDMIEENKKALGIDDSISLIKVGDTPVDMQEGKNAGAYAVGVILGSSELGLTYEEVSNMHPEELQERINKVEERLYDAGADYVMKDVRELLDIVEIINRGE